VSAHKKTRHGAGLGHETFFFGGIVAARVLLHIRLMQLSLENIARLLSGSDSIPAGRLINQARRHISQKTNTVLLSSDTTRHILTKHGDHVEPSTLLLLPDALKNGLWIADRERSCRITYVEPRTGIRFLIAIKATKNRQEVYVGTLHRCAKGQTKALLKRGNILRPHL